MEIPQNRKLGIRQQIITASHIYRDHLAGKVFLYVYGDEYFEVVFQTDRFMHLTGVNSYLKAQEFYAKATAAHLTTGQIYFDNTHSYGVAKKKLPCLIQLPLLTNSLVCVVKDMKTLTLTYKLGVTNLDFTIGLTENTDFEGHKINDWFLPRTLRVKDHTVENSSDAQFIDFIFMKDASCTKYANSCYQDTSKCTPDSIRHLLSQNLIDTLYQTEE